MWGRGLPWSTSIKIFEIQDLWESCGTLFHHLTFSSSNWKFCGSSNRLQLTMGNMVVLYLLRFLWGKWIITATVDSLSTVILWKLRKDNFWKPRKHTSCKFFKRAANNSCDIYLSWAETTRTHQIWDLWVNFTPLLSQYFPHKPTKSTYTK